MEDTHREAIERPERIRLDEVLVELCTDSPDEAFEADALNVSPGGLALRSPLLPEVGSRMRCRFQSPLDGTTIHADCEVVWSADQGPNLGEFGLRFERLSGESAEALRQLVELEDRVMTPTEAADLGWSPAPVSGPVTIALSLEGVGSELIAEVAHESDDVLVAEQELPFLRLGTSVVTEEGRRGVLQSVELRLDGELPRLVLTIGYDDESIAGASSDELDAASAAAYDADDDLDPGDDCERASIGDDHDTLPDGSMTFEDRPTTELYASGVAVPVTDEDARADEPRPRARVREVGEPVLAKASAVASAVKDATSERFSSAIPVVRDGLENARETATAAASSGLSRLLEALRTLAAHVRRFVTVFRARQASTVAAATPPRRVQRRPGERASEVPAAEPEPKVRGRHVVLGAFGLLVLLLAVRGVLRAPDSAAAPVLAPAPSASAAVVETAPAAIAAPTPVPTGSVPPPVPTVSTPALAAGPMPSPTYPSMTRPDQAAEAAAPAPAPVTPPSRHFGAATVPGAMPFELLMTTPIERIDGQTTESGFVVQITRSNSLTRASPIAAQHPAVDRASVSNLGENATLRIDFKPGQHPAYRVEANGNRLRILIGR